MSTENKATSNPNLGELWDCENRIAFIAGNSFNEIDRVWVMDWQTGERGDAKLDGLILRDDRFSVSKAEMLEKFSLWSRNGNADAMWFLAYWFEGINHPKSTWYYIAALRANPDQHKWAYSRIVGDTKSAYMCEGIPKPSLDFLADIPEMQEAKIYCSLWRKAVEQAEIAMHIAAG